MGTVTIITRQGLRVIDAQDVDEELVPDVLAHIEREHAGEGLRISVVPVGFSRFLV